MKISFKKMKLYLKKIAKISYNEIVSTVFFTIPKKKNATDLITLLLLFLLLLLISLVLFLVFSCCLDF